MTHRGPFQLLLFCDSVIMDNKLKSNGNALLLFLAEYITSEWQAVPYFFPFLSSF